MTGVAAAQLISASPAHTNPLLPPSRTAVADQVFPAAHAARLRRGGVWLRGKVLGSPGCNLRCGRAQFWHGHWRPVGGTHPAVAMFAFATGSGQGPARNQPLSIRSSRNLAAGEARLWCCTLNGEDSGRLSRLLLSVRPSDAGRTTPTEERPGEGGILCEAMRPHQLLRQKR